jgi:hypothetical protein
MINPFLGFKTCNHSSKTRSSGRPGSMPGFWVLTGLVLFFLNQNDVILVKKTKKKTKVNGFATESYRVSRVAGSHRVFSSPIFSSTRPGSSPGSARSRGDPPGRAGFQNYAWNIGHEYLA